MESNIAKKTALKNDLPKGYGPLSDKQKKIYEILLTPIIVDKGYDKIRMDKEEKIIKSGQKYYCQPDPDMSDFAVEFYKKIYDITILKKESRYLKSPIFCGDTMNSYKNIVKLVGEENAEEWRSRYHCLANFWILPMDVGHSSSWTGKRGLMKLSKSQKEFDDYMDKFLENYFANKAYNSEVPLDTNKYKYKDPNDKYKKYVDKFTQEIQDFSEKHFLNGSYIKDKEVLKFSFSKKRGENKDSGEAIIDEIWERIKIRAVKIAQDKDKEEELYEYFHKMNLV